MFLPTSALQKPPDDGVTPFTIPQFFAASRLASDTSGLEFAAVKATVNPMPDFQFFFVVLAMTQNVIAGCWDNVSSKILRPMTWETPSLKPEPQYRLIVPPSDQRPGLPAQSLAWTPIAYLLWDDWQPGDLSADQQQALVDWLHWGGQLIISGPRSLAGLSQLSGAVSTGKGGPNRGTLAHRLNNSKRSRSKSFRIGRS